MSARGWGSDVWLVSAVLAIPTVGCSDSGGGGGPDSAPDMAGSSAGAGTGGASGAAGSGSGGGTSGAFGSRAGSGAGSGGTGGSAPSGGSGEAGSAGSAAGPMEMLSMQLPALASFDLEGLNEDLPEPAGGQDCLTTPNPLVGCMRVSVEYDDEQHDFGCVDSSGPIVAAFLRSRRMRAVGCGLDLAADDDLTVGVGLGAPLFATPLPASFDLTNAPGMDQGSVVSFARLARGVGTHQEIDYVMADTHTFEGRVSGETWISGEWTGDPTTSRISEFARGAFAATLTPLSSCTPDAEGVGCDMVRMRGTFHVRTQNSVSIGTEGENCIEPPGAERCAPGLQCVIPAGQEIGTCTSM